MKKASISELKNQLSASLQRAGIITPPGEPLSLDLVRTPLPGASQSVVAAMLEDRADGR